MTPEGFDAASEEARRRAEEARLAAEAARMAAAQRSEQYMQSNRAAALVAMATVNAAAQKTATIEFAHAMNGKTRAQETYFHPDTDPELLNRRSLINVINLILRSRQKAHGAHH